ncbi:UDP-N-acetylglucosamine 1-carboxyvinyltransferase [Demequina muriae]|uniref:UDP-N-acetylglucosamine 1-carboxyvinyltransferase n=1 Tax=Demequina muriae TaxID=3051664 RepID=A0ABT8GIR4_9MICO|nr:UDP-N-acetylglucosamine 1-carboxyvinyltransferase [Demequina sp. EGI L300058]MDN4481319.1 UDP-N-acetylglucosamine 1-carboxyvinyltransferase [Demequina sp. EGI L300058]
MTDSIRVHGGEPLRGEITVRGAKNFVSKAMVAALLGSTPSTLRNVPNIRDVKVVSELLRLHGAGVDYNVESGEIALDTTSLQYADALQIATHAGSSRIPILLCGPLLHRLGEAVIPDLGGCRIGDRPINFHLEILQKFGAQVEEGGDGLHLTAPNGLTGIAHTLSYPSVGATEQLLLTGVLAKGITTLENAAVEPEIKDLIDTLQKMGAIISVDTDRSITIEGVETLHGYDHTALADRIEVGSWASAALATRGDVMIHGAQQRTMGMFLNVFRKVGGEFDVRQDGIRFWHPGGDLNAIALQTDVHPGFMTDWQQPLVVALTQAKGLSIVHETVYENRFGFTEALVAMGAEVQLYRECLGDKKCRFGQRNFRHSAVISGPTPLHAADIEVPDLRGGFSHLIAALAAKGTSTVSGIGIIDRGYEAFRDKLTALGAAVE